MYTSSIKRIDGVYNLGSTNYCFKQTCFKIETILRLHCVLVFVYIYIYIHIYILNGHLNTMPLRYSHFIVKHPICHINVYINTIIAWMFDWGRGWATRTHKRQSREETSSISFTQSCAHHSCLWAWMLWNYQIFYFTKSMFCFRSYSSLSFFLPTWFAQSVAVTSWLLCARPVEDIFYISHILLTVSLSGSTKRK